MAAVKRDYLGCGHARRTGQCANRRSIRRGAVEALILDALRHNRMAPDLVAELIAAYHAELNQLRHHVELNGSASKRRLAEIVRKLAGLYDAIAEGLRTPGLKGKLEDLEAERERLAAEIASAPAPLPRLHPNLAELYRRKVADLQALFRDEATRDEAIASLRGLVERVVVHRGDAGPEIELIGEIAGMVRLAQGVERRKVASDESAFPELFERSVKVVAGTGCQRYLRLLEGWL